MATLRTYRSLLRDPTFVALVLVAGLMMSALFSYVSGSSFVLQGIYGLDPRTFGIVFGCNALGIVLGTQLNPLLLQRHRPSQVLTFAVVGATTAAAAMLLTTSTGFGGLFGLLVPLALVVACCGLVLPNTPALALSRHGDSRSGCSRLLQRSRWYWPPPASTGCSRMWSGRDAKSSASASPSVPRAAKSLVSSCEEASHQSLPRSRPEPLPRSCWRRSFRECCSA